MIAERLGVFIDNKMVPSEGEVLEVRSPANQELVGRVTMATRADMARAVASARHAFDEGPWPRTPYEERRAVLLRAAELLEPQADALSALVTSENGVSIAFRQGAVGGSFRYHASLDHPAPEFRDSARGGALVVREPAGVVAAIVPWNSPVSLGLSKVLPALMAGCTVVLKPAPETPLHDYVIAEALAEAGLPPGALSVVPADREVSESLVENQAIDMVSFTGSTAAGRRIGAICGQNIKRMVLELGGKSAAIVLPDVDLEAQAANILRTGMLRNNGQACVAWTRILVPRAQHDEMVDAFVAELEKVTVGDPFDPTMQLGPLVAERQRDRVEGYIRSGVEEGARIVFGGGRPAGLEAGWYVEPTLFVDARNDMTMCREEIFGPVGTVMPYDDEADAVRVANDTNYGLGGAVFTSDIAHGIELAGQIRAGTIGVNVGGVGEQWPFGGYKDSGVGRAHGPEGFAEYFQYKSIGLPAGYVPPGHEGPTEQERP